MPSSVVNPKDCPAIRSALDGGRRHGLWQAATHCFALALACAAPSGSGGRSCVSALGFRPAAGRGPARAARQRPLRVSETALKGDRARTKFIIGLERTVEFQVFSLTNPNRVFVELPDVMLQLPPQPGEAAVGLVKSFRGGQSAPGKARVVIDVTGPVVVDKAAIEKSKDGKTAQLVLEIVPAACRLARSPRPTPSGRLMQAGASGPRRGRRAAAHAAGPRCRRSSARSACSSPSSSSTPDTAATTPGRRRTAPSRRTWCWRSASCCATSSTPPAATRC